MGANKELYITVKADHILTKENAIQFFIGNEIIRVISLYTLIDLQRM